MKATNPDTEGSKGSRLLANPRDIDTNDASGWKRTDGGSTDMVSLGPDTEASRGSRELKGHRDYDAYGGDDWQGTDGLTTMKGIEPDTEGSKGSRELHGNRDYDSFGAKDWQGTDGRTTMKATNPDTEGSKGSRLLANPRDIDTNDASGWKRTDGGNTDMVSLGPDTEASRGSRELLGNRDYNHFGSGDWQGTDGRTTMQDIQPDTEGSRGSIAFRTARDIDADSAHHWAHNGKRSAMRSLGLDTSPSRGRNTESSRSIRNSFNTSGSSAQAMGLDTTPSRGNISSKMPRDISHYGADGSGWDRAQSSLVPLEIDTTRTEHARHHRDFDVYDDDWNIEGHEHDPTLVDTERGANTAANGPVPFSTSGTGLAPLSIDTTPSSGSNEMYFSRDFDHEEDWRYSSKNEGGQLRSTKSLTNNMFGPSNGCASASHDFRTLSTSKPWRPQTRPHAHKGLDQDANTFIVAPVLTTEEVRNFKFRELDRHASSDDWRPSMQKFSKSGLFAPAPLLAREPYIDPARRTKSVRDLPPTKLTASKAPTRTPRLDPTGGIATSLNKRKAKEAANATGASSLKIISAAEYNGMVTNLVVLRTTFNATVAKLNEALNEDEGAEHEDAKGAEMIKSSKHLLRLSQKILNKNKNFAKKTGAIQLFEYRELSKDTNEIKDTIRVLNTHRLVLLKTRAALMYSPFGIEDPDVVIVQLHEGKPLGLTVSVSPDLAFGLRITEIDRTSWLADRCCGDVQEGDALLEVSGMFVMDSSLDEVCSILARQEGEAVLTFIKKDYVSKVNDRETQGLLVPPSPTRTQIHDAKLLHWQRVLDSKAGGGLNNSRIDLADGEDDSDDSPPGSSEEYYRHSGDKSATDDRQLGPEPELLSPAVTPNRTPMSTPHTSPWRSPLSAPRTPWEDTAPAYQLPFAAGHVSPFASRIRGLDRDTGPEHVYQVPGDASVEDDVANMLTAGAVLNGKSTAAGKAKYDWEVGPDCRERLEARREELLHNDHLTGEPALMEEWLAVLLARSEYEGGDEELRGGPTNVAKSAKKKMNKFFGKIGDGLVKLLH